MKQKELTCQNKSNIKYINNTNYVSGFCQQKHGKLAQKIQWNSIIPIVYKKIIIKKNLLTVLLNLKNFTQLQV